MPLAAGARLGPYEVVGPIGAGGMGEVYRARDTRLGRDVAVKVLPAERLSDSHRRARFAQEARAASALNHPNIVTIHEIESAEGIDFIVMELVPGETLAQRLRHGALGTDEALRLAIPVADALSAAHAAGIVHRDLKPGNVMVRRDGVAKVLDFGLAKLVRDDTADSDEATATAPPDAAPLSRPGAVTGTAGYMSPEQASGSTVDARSDVFAFGLLLYEMVTGRRAFAGSSSAEAMAAVLKDQPKPPGELAPDLPKELERIILRCLRKDPGRRFQSMADVKIELLEVKEESDSQASAPAGSATAWRVSRRRWMAWSAVGLLITAVATTLAWWRLRQGDRPAPRLVPLSWTGRDGAGTFSPDGNQIAFSSSGDEGDNEDIWLKIVGEAEARRLTTDPAPERWPAWSPDGRQIAFVRVAFEGIDSISLVSPLGGPERRLLDFPTPGQLSWSPDGRWLAAARTRAKGESTPESGGIHLIPTGGGEPHAITFPRQPIRDAFPAFSPDGRRLAYASCGGQGEVPSCDVYVLALDSGRRPQGGPRRVTERHFWAAGLAWTRDGRSILYASASPDDGLMRVRADGSSPPERIDLAGGGTGFPTVARTQERLVFHRVRWNPDIYHLPLGGSPSPLITSTFPDIYPQYSPDGRRIAFQSGRAGEGGNIWLANADGSSPTRLTRGPDRGHGSPRWSPDGRSIAFDVLGQDGRFDVWTIDVDGSGLRQVTRDPADDFMASWSRDGRLLYFSSNRTGRDEVWRVGLEGGSEEQLTRDGGCLPMESLDGRTLYYMRKCLNSALLARPTAGAEERTIFRCVDLRSFAVAAGGVFHVDCANPGASHSSRLVVRYWDAATGQDRPVGAIEAAWTGGLSAAPDGKSLVFSSGTLGSELMMIENFR